MGLTRPGHGPDTSTTGGGTRAEHSGPAVRSAYPLYEFALTTALLFAVVTLVRWLMAPGSTLFLAYPARSRRLPLCLAAATAVTVGVLGPLSGGATNPARQFGPVLLSGTYGYLAVYLIAPVIGAALGAGIHQLLQRYGPARRVPTYRLCPDTTDPGPA